MRRGVTHQQNALFGFVVVVLGILVLLVPAFLQAVVGIILVVIGLLAVAGRVPCSNSSRARFGLIVRECRCGTTLRGVGQSRTNAMRAETPLSPST